MGSWGFKEKVDVGMLSEWIVGQEVAVVAMADCLRGCMNLQHWSRPWGVVLAGPKGVGKSLAAECSARCLGERVYSVNLSGYESAESVVQLMGGSCSVKGGEGVLPALVRTHKDKRMVLVFEEPERVHVSFWVKVIRLLEEGTVGEREFEVKMPDQTIVYFVTNQNGEEIAIRGGQAEEILAKSGIFPDALYPRIEKVIGFTRLSEAAQAEILWRLAREFCLEQKVELEEMSPRYLCGLLEMSEKENSRLYGGHVLKRIVRREISRAIAAQCKGSRARLQLN